MTDLLVVKAKLKDVCGSCNVAGDLAESLDKKARELMKDAVARAKDNGRRTVMAKDVACNFVAKKADTMLVVRAKLKDVAEGCNVAGDLADALNNALNKCLLKAVERAKENKRNTAMAKDI